MEFSVEQIAGILNGEIVGDSNVSVTGLSKIEEGQPGTLSFLANPKYEEYIYSTGASVVIVNKTFEPRQEIPASCTLVKVEDAYACFAKLLEAYNQFRVKQPKIEQPSFISDSASVGENLYLGAFAYLGEDVVIGSDVKIYPGAYIGDNVKIGDGCVIYPGVKIYPDCVLGKHCVIHAGAVIGSDGFGFAPNQENEYNKVPQIGNVVLEDFVEIGANTTVDRATLGSTILRKGVKLDNLVQIAHNVEIGENTVMAAQVGVAGSTKVGKNVMMGGQVGVSGHIKIADGVKVAAQSGIPNNIKKEGDVLLGSPAIPIEDFKKSYFGFRKLPMILKRLQAIEEKLKS
ncbi:UDP-3-O-(3-hydroxymyristoyl)glucosamine N-acyltransferase [Wandonia haliotis]|uniref:UDP-3-O-acylglucosamine N-acyltransferase n=1 Tax=Wandonia haliotis TaxID=574963 RepID=A0ABN1MP89_9FLAO